MPTFGIKERRKHRGREVAHTLSTPGGWNWAHFGSTMCVGPQFEILADFLNFHIWACNLEFEERTQSCICTLFLPQGIKIKLIFALRATVFEIRAGFSKLPYLGMKSRIWKKCWKLHMDPLSTPGGRNWAYFALRAVVSEREQFKVLISLIN